jgi:hypothetical protein
MAIDLNGSTGISLDDNEKINIGNDSDLQIYHDGSNSYITDQGTGNLRIRGTSIELSNADGSKRYGEYLDGDAVKLYHNGSKKFETTSTGVDVTGTVTSDGLTVSTSASGFASQITNNNDSSQGLQVRTSDNDGGQFILDLQSSSSATGTDYASKFVVTKNGNVGIGTSSPSKKFVVSEGGAHGFEISPYDGSQNATRLLNYNRSTNAYFPLEIEASQIAFEIDGSESMRIDSSGRVGIGTSSLGGGRGLTVANGAVAVTGQNTSHSASSMVLGQDSTAISQIRFYGADNSTAGVLEFTGSSANGSVGGERMRIDASGNLLVGKTSTAFNTAGVNITPFGSAEFTRNSVVMNLNRLSSDGDIQRFYKDGTVVGAIKVFSAGEVTFGSEHVNGGGLYFTSDKKVLPTVSGSLSDNAVDIGKPTQRFQDVYAVNYHGNGSNLTGVGGSTAYGAVGTYIVGRSTSTSTMAAGSTRAGSGIRSMGHSWRNFGGNLTEGTGNNTAGGNLSGTWRIMADTSTGLTSGHYPGGIWVRIS